MLRIAWDPIYCHPLPEGHRFPMIKYELIPEQLLHEGSISETQLFSPTLMEEELVLSIHDETYFNKLLRLELTKQEERKTGFPLSDALVHRERVIMQGTVDAAVFAMKNGIAMNAAGGTHHAFRDRGEGFCLLNDIALGAQYLMDHHQLARILVVDLDVHQGNGTASIFEHEPRVFTFSMHGDHNYPLQKERSDLDIPLPDKITDGPYLALLDRHLNETFELFQPQFVFYQCGVDILSTDALGRLSVSEAGCKQRDRMVFEMCYRHRIPVCASMGGGYSPNIKHIIEAHCNTFRLAQEIFF